MCAWHFRSARGNLALATARPVFFNFSTTAPTILRHISRLTPRLKVIARKAHTMALPLLFGLTMPNHPLGCWEGVPGEAGDGGERRVGGLNACGDVAGVDEGGAEEYEGIGRAGDVR
jgi:hypothetical protein